MQLKQLLLEIIVCVFFHINYHRISSRQKGEKKNLTYYDKHLLILLRERIINCLFFYLMLNETFVLI